MSTTRKQKRFNEHSFELELTEKKKQVEAYMNMLQAIEDIDDEAHSIEELNTRLNERTGFTNPKFSAMAFDKGTLYEYALEQEQKCKDIDPKDITKDWELTEEAIQTIKEKHTIYYSDEELEAKKKLEKVIDLFNGVPLEYRRLVGMNAKLELMFSPFAHRI